LRKVTFSSGLALVLALCVSSASAQQMRGALFIGGPGSCSSSGLNDPGLLNDGVTAASSQWGLLLDRENSTLYLRVENTSPVTRGVPNPLLVRFYFNTPPEVTDMTLVSQSATRDTTPAFVLHFDPDLTTDPNPNSASIFGQFNVFMDNPGGTDGAIANASADALTGTNPVFGPVIFTFALTGDVSSLVADDFTTNFSATPPGTKPALGVAKFRNGGVAQSYGYVNESTYCDSAAEVMTLGQGCGAVMTATAPTMGSMCTMTVSNSAPNSMGWAFSSMPGTPSMLQGCQIFVAPPRRMFKVFMTDDDGNATFEAPVPVFFNSPECCGASFALQSIVFTNSGAIPLGNLSNGCLVTIGG